MTSKGCISTLVVSIITSTLIVIYLRAVILGEACTPARDVIDAFLGGWRHAFDSVEDATET